MLSMAQPFLERNMHPTVICRGYTRALNDAKGIVSDLAFNIDIDNSARHLVFSSLLH